MHWLVVSSLLVAKLLKGNDGQCGWQPENKKKNLPAVHTMIIPVWVTIIRKAVMFCENLCKCVKILQLLYFIYLNNNLYVWMREWMCIYAGMLYYRNCKLFCKPVSKITSAQILPEGQWSVTLADAVDRQWWPVAAEVPIALGLSAVSQSSRCRRWSTTFSIKVCIIFIEDYFGVGIDMHISILYLYTCYKVCQHATTSVSEDHLSVKSLQNCTKTCLQWHISRLHLTSGVLVWLQTGHWLDTLVVEMPATVIWLLSDRQQYTTLVLCGRQPFVPHNKIWRPSILPASVSLPSASVSCRG